VNDLIGHSYLAITISPHPTPAPRNSSNQAYAALSSGKNSTNTFPKSSFNAAAARICVWAAVRIGKEAGAEAESGAEAVTEAEAEAEAEAGAESGAEAEAQAVAPAAAEAFPSQKRFRARLQLHGTTNTAAVIPCVACGWQ